MKLTKTIKACLLIITLFPLGSIYAANKVFKGVVGTYSQLSGDPVTAAAVDVGDLTRSGVQTGYYDTLQTNGSKKLFYLVHRPIHQLSSVTVNGSLLPSTDSLVLAPNYAYHIKNGWISFAKTYLSTDSVKVFYEWSNNLDVVVGNDNNPSTVQADVSYKNNGNFNFVQNGTAIGPGAYSRSVAIADSNGDGFSDIAIGNWGGLSKVFINDGAGNFPTSVNLESGNSRMFVWGDIDGDGILDLAKANGNLAASKIYKNSGTGTFTELWNNGGSPDARSLDLGDFNKDGAMDLVIGNAGGTLEVWKNQPASFLYVWDYNGHRIVKLNARTYQELASVQTYNTSNGHTFNYPSPSWDYYVKGLAIDSEYLYVSNTNACTLVKLKKSDFSFVSEVGAYGVCGVSPAGPDDFNHPWGLSVDETYLYVGDKHNLRLEKRLKSDLSFVSSTTPVGYDYSYGNEVDSTSIYIANTYSNNIKKIRKDNYAVQLTSPTGYASGHNNFTYDTPSDVVVDDTYMYVVDMYNDRIVKKNKNTLVYVSQVGSQGSGINNFSNPENITQDATSLWISDTVNSRIQHRLKSTLALVEPAFNLPYLPEAIVFDQGGMGDFVKVWTSPINMPVLDVQWADIDNDGDLDLVVANDNNFSSMGRNNLVYRNDGLDASGNPIFFKVWESSTSSKSKGVSIGDVDGDSYQDFVFVNDNDTSAVSLFTNNHSGGFTYSWGSNEESGNYNNFMGSQVRLADFNKDGKLDIVTSAKDSSSLTNEFTGIVIFQNQPMAKKVVKVQSVSSDGKRKTTVTTYYRVNADGTLGKVLSTEIK